MGADLGYRGPRDGLRAAETDTESGRPRVLREHRAEPPGCPNALQYEK